MSLKITHQDVDQATAEFLKKGGKIKKVKSLIDGPDILERWNDAEITFNKSRYSQGYLYKHGVLRNIKKKEAAHE